MKVLLLLALLLLPGAALAHGDAHAPEPEKRHFVGHPCPAGTGECCCAKPLSSGTQPPPVAAPAWRVVFLPGFPAPRPLATAARTKDVRLSKNPRAPPLSS
jgi:hypothetical protein